MSSAIIHVRLAFPELYVYRPADNAGWEPIPILNTSLAVSAEPMPFAFGGYADPHLHQEQIASCRRSDQCWAARGSFYLNSAGFAQEFDPDSPPSRHPCNERVLLTADFPIRRASELY